MPNNDYDELEKLITEGQAGKALEQLRQMAGEQAPGWNALIALLQTRWSRLEQQEMAGTLSQEEAALQRNKINLSVLQLVGRHESQSPSLARVIKEMQHDYSLDDGIPVYPQNTTQITGSPININNKGDAVIGSGNTISRKIFHALGRWQFVALLLGLAALGSLGYFYGGKAMESQEASFASLSNIQKELAALVRQDANIGSWSLAARQEVDASLAAGMQALQDGDYPTALHQLEEVSALVQLATVYKNMAYVAGQMGDWEKASKYRKQALQVDPKVYPEQDLASLKGRRINLLLPEHGGKMLAGDASIMEELANGLTDVASNQYRSWAVFGFKDGHAALIDEVDFYVGYSYGQVSFELLAGNESPTGPFTSIGVFKPFDGLLTATPFQPFTFAPVRAKYVKFQLTEGLYWYELRLWGKLE